MIAIFELGSLAFWLLLFTAFVIVIMAQEIADSPGSWSTFWVILTFVILYFCGSRMEIQQFGVYIIQHIVQTMVYFLLYIVVGTCWSFTKWHELVSKAYVAYLYEVERYRVDYPERVVNQLNFRPVVNRNKAKLFNWIFYWPFSVAWFFIHKPIEKLFRFIMKYTRKIYEGITDRAFNKGKE